MNQDKLKEFEPIFYPRSIAVVGVSKDEQKWGTRFFRGLVNAGFKGKVYPVIPSDDKIEDFESYSNLKLIPGPVDHVIVSVPARFALQVLDDCTAKGVKVVDFFTAGFSETGEEQGCELEREMTQKAAKGGFRIIGPNCMGVYHPAYGKPWGGAYKQMGEPGTIGIISQSGGHGYWLVVNGFVRGIRFSKGVSFGNGCDLDSVDFFEYLAADPDTKIIGAYLEGMRDSRQLFEVIKELSNTKPVVVWKGGRTKGGAAAVASHTGSLAGSDTIWEAALKQAGAIMVHSHEEWVDTLLAFQDLTRFEGNRVSIISGLGGGGGGASVSATDAFIALGLDVPPFTDVTRTGLRNILPPVGSILRNPLDPGGIGGNLDIFKRMIELVITDPNIDLVILNDRLAALSESSRNWVNAISEILINFRKTQSKPIVIVSAPELAGAESREVEKTLSDAQIPVFPSLDRAAKALANIIRYWELVNIS